MEPVIRKATVDDLVSIQRLNSDLFEFDKDRDPTLNFDWPYAEGEDYFRKRIEGSGFVVVAEADGNVVGYLCGAMMAAESFRAASRADLENMYIDEEFRHGGLGTDLARQFFAWAAEQGADEVTVNAYCGNDNAIDFYESVGFKPYFLELRIFTKDMPNTN